MTKPTQEEIQMDLKQSHQKHKQLHGEKAVTYKTFRDRRKKRGMKEAIKHPRGYNHGGPRPPKKNTITNFRRENYSTQYKLSSFYQQLRKNYKLSREFQKRLFFRTKQ